MVGVQRTFTEIGEAVSVSMDLPVYWFQKLYEWLHEHNIWLPFKQQGILRG